MVAFKEASVYLLAGTEQFLKEENIARIKSTFLDREYEDFNFNVFYAGSNPCKKILECANTSPFLGRKRVVLVRQIENFSAADERFILSYMRAPHKQTLLILETSKTDLSYNFFAEICKYARIIFCNPLKANQLLDWIKSQLKTKGKKIEQKALELLVDNLGDNLQLLNSSLDNLVLYVGERELIEIFDVERLVGPDVDTGVFELFDAIVVQDKEKSFQILDSLLKDGVNPSQILGALAHRIISEKAKLGPFLFERYLLNLQQTDNNIKTGRQEQRLALELLIARLLDFS